MKKVYTFKIHQRLNAQNQQFYEWLIGLTEGDGCFSLNKQKRNWVVGFKIALHKSDIKTLIYIKKNCHCGKIGWANREQTIIQFRVRNLQHLFDFIFPIFDTYPMITNKNRDYFLIRQAADLLYQKSQANLLINKIEKLYSELREIRKQRTLLASLLATRVNITDPQAYCESLGISIDWIRRSCLLENYMVKGIEGFEALCQNASKYLSSNWIIGFFQAEGSFYVQLKDNKTNRYCCGFGIIASNPFILEVLKRKLHIPSQIKERLNSGKLFYQLDNTNSRANQYMNQFCYKHLPFVGLKSLQYRIWSRCLQSKSTPLSLQKTQQLLRKLSKSLIIIKSIVN
jgi:hypothetical protein